MTEVQAPTTCKCHNPDLLQVTQKLVNALVDAKAANLELIRGTNAQVMKNLSTYKPEPLHGWRLNADRALKQAAAFVTVPEASAAAAEDYLEYVPPADSDSQP